MVDVQALSHSAVHPSHTPRRVRSRTTHCPAEPSDADSVKALLERDRRILELPEQDPFADEGPPSEPTVKKAPSPAAGRQSATKRTQVIEEETKAGTPLPERKGPKVASEAIEKGIATLQQGDPEGAIQLFQRALELPGRGAFRLQGSAKEYSCASEGEEVAALYNLACAYVACGQRDAALASLEGAIDAGFNDWDVLRSDQDLRALQGPQLESLLGKKPPGSFRSQLDFLAALNPFRRRP